MQIWIIKATGPRQKKNRAGVEGGREKKERKQKQRTAAVQDKKQSHGFEERLPRLKETVDAKIKTFTIIYVIM